MNRIPTAITWRVRRRLILSLFLCMPLPCSSFAQSSPSAPKNLRVVESTAVACPLNVADACGANLGDFLNCGDVTYCDQRVNCGTTCPAGQCGFTGGVVPRPNYCEPGATCVNTADNACFHRNCGQATICSTNYDCGACAPGFVCGRDSVANVCGESACVPNNAAACSGRSCGRTVNNCGETISCGGSCSAGKVCESGTCRTQSCPSLLSRLTVRKLAVAPSAAGIFVNRGDAGFSYWQVATLKAVAIPTAVPGGLGGGTVVAWNPAAAGSIVSEVHLSRFAPDGSRVLPDFVVPGKRILGVMAFADGYAVVVHRTVPCPPGSSIPPTDCINTTLTRFDLNGSVVLNKDIQLVESAGNGGPWNAPGGGFRWNGNNYMTFVGAGTFGHGGTAGILSDINGSRVRWPQWNLGCSHLYGDARVAMNGNRIGSVCSCDALPLGHNYWSTTAGTIFPTTDGYGQILFGAKWNLARLGELVPAPNGFYAAYAAPDRPGNGSANDRNDIAISFFDFDDSTYSTGGMPRTWITQTPTIDETAPHIVPFEDGYLAGWRTAPIECTVSDISEGKCSTLGERAKYYLLKLDVNRNPVGIPQELGEANGTPVWFHDHEEFFSYPNGDVGWVWVAQWFNPSGAAANVAELLHVRIQTCGAA